ncbi:Fe(3+)-dicitrate ABC transporter ATP-binding protein [Rhodobacter sp. TJ_12]|uniref:ABC transporter ATP-binding protein n=1 Tax=Rhodobacter sp. TJ_12 TaxID=2029399 RepID=UPI001CC05183|nr:ABC transporter ATP-binding protein [Rhodobacter sp. TJ_12]MBZ4023718.1 Fe(3+)-dicitrate ABC transporter ATP-binding protein [Rhodobacter sp. TJ_12]
MRDEGKGAAKTGAQSRLKTQALQLGYAGRKICAEVSLAVPEGRFSVILGPNGCGKSTLLRGLCNLLPPQAGQVLLDGQVIARLPARRLAQQIGLLPQSAQAPSGITVEDLVARGRYPYQGPFRQWSPEDARIVAEAMAATGVTDLAQTEVGALSGGQRQRVWIALVLAQQTPILLLDEPTTFLDIAHQLELLELLQRLNRDQGRTIVAVLHDLNQACRYADHLVVMAAGRVVAEGPPARLMTPGLLRQVFGLEAVILDDPISHTPLIVAR